MPARGAVGAGCVWEVRKALERLEALEVPRGWRRAGTVLKVQESL